MKCIGVLELHVQAQHRFDRPLTFTICLCTLPLQVDYALIASQAGATLNNLLSRAQELVSKLRSLQLDQREFVCLKFLVLFSLGE